MKRIFSIREIGQTVIALLLIFLCLLAGQWQWNKGKARSQQNAIITTNQTLPELPESELWRSPPTQIQWRNVQLQGHFLNNHQLLLRNRYFQGQYGFEVLTLLTTSHGMNYWLDRGWVKAGANAQTPPQVPSPSVTTVSIRARVRSDDISRQIEGTFFALPGSHKITTDLSHAQDVVAAPFYLDLLSGSDAGSQPLNQISLPELNNGPHFAYAIQWLAFAFLIVVGRILLFRETKRLPLI
ncbi:MAG: SURF1 family protein [Actinomycetes bacterium]